jgi:glycyl-tRNA synthetase
LSYFDQATNSRYIPYVIEPAAGCDRATLAFLLSAYHEEEVKGEKRVVLKLHRDLAPYQVAILPLSKNDQLVPLAQKVADILRPTMSVDMDVTQSIGKRYRRQDEIGTPQCVTIDFESLEDNAVTIRDRDTMEQERVSIDRLLEFVGSRS